MIADDVDTAGALAETIRTAVYAALVDCGYDPPRMTYNAAGLIAWDDCCGTLVVAPERIYRTEIFPIEGRSDVACAGGEIAVDLVALLIRCVPVIDDTGNPPTQTALDNAYRGILDEAAVVWNTIAGPLPLGVMRANLAQTFVGAQGGCIGVETRVTLGTDTDAWCPPCAQP